jgi:hypothetical protein
MLEFKQCNSSNNQLRIIEIIVKIIKEKQINYHLKIIQGKLLKSKNDYPIFSYFLLNIQIHI